MENGLLSMKMLVQIWVKIGNDIFYTPFLMYIFALTSVKNTGGQKAIATLLICISKIKRENNILNGLICFSNSILGLEMIQEIKLTLVFYPFIYIDIPDNCALRLGGQLMTQERATFFSDI